MGRGGREGRRVEVHAGGGGGGQENQLIAHTINLIIPKLKGINRRVIDRLITSRSVFFYTLEGQETTVNLQKKCKLVIELFPSVSCWLSMVYSVIKIIRRKAK